MKKYLLLFVLFLTMGCSGGNENITPTNSINIKNDVDISDYYRSYYVSAIDWQERSFEQCQLLDVEKTTTNTNFKEIWDAISSSQIVFYEDRTEEIWPTPCEVNTNIDNNGFDCRGISSYYFNIVRENIEIADEDLRIRIYCSEETCRVNAHAVVYFELKNEGHIIDNRNFYKVKDYSVNKVLISDFNLFDYWQHK